MVTFVRRRLKGCRGLCEQADSDARPMRGYGTFHFGICTRLKNYCLLVFYSFRHASQFVSLIFPLTAHVAQ